MTTIPELGQAHEILLILIMNILYINMINNVCVFISLLQKCIYRYVSEQKTGS